MRFDAIRTTTFVSGNLTLRPQFFLFRQSERTPMNRHLSIAFAVCVAAFTLLTSGCANYDQRLTDNSTRYLGSDGSIVTKPSGQPVDNISYWDGSNVSGSPSIIIRLRDQTASFYKGDKLVGVSAISTGREGFETPTGRFKIIQKNIDHHSTLYGDYVDAQGNILVRDVDVKKDPKPPGAVFAGAPMPFFMRVHGGVGMHQGFLPGVPDSHGCIRMPRNMAEIYFANAPMNTPVTIVN